MTIMMSCDHHPPNRGIPDNRSRARMLVQLRAATALSDMLGELFKHGIVRHDVLGPKVVSLVDTEAAIPLLQAWLHWLAVAPSGDDWAEPYDPPAEIRVPPEGDPP